MTRKAGSATAVEAVVAEEVVAVESLAVIEGENIALGLNKDLFTFAKNNGFKTYRDFNIGMDVKQIEGLIANPNNKLHFNLDGFSNYQFSKFNPNGFINHGNITNWELHTIQNSSALQRTTFYRNGIITTF